MRGVLVAALVVQEPVGEDRARALAPARLKAGGEEVGIGASALRALGVDDKGVSNSALDEAAARALSGPRG